MVSPTIMLSLGRLSAQVYTGPHGHMDMQSHSIKPTHPQCPPSLSPLEALGHSVCESQTRLEALGEGFRTRRG